MTLSVLCHTCADWKTDCENTCNTCFFPSDLTVRFMTRMEILYRPWSMTETKWMWEALRLSLTTSTLCITHQRKGDYQHRFTRSFFFPQRWRPPCWTSHCFSPIYVHVCCTFCVNQCNVSSKCCQWLMRRVHFNLILNQICLLIQFPGNVISLNPAFVKKKLTLMNISNLQEKRKILNGTWHWRLHNEELSLKWSWLVFTTVLKSYFSLKRV